MGCSFKGGESGASALLPASPKKAADLAGLRFAGLCPNPPENAAAISAGEKTSIQAIERPNGFAMTKPGEIVRGVKSA